MTDSSAVEKSKVKVVQCWDDGVLDDIRVIEILRKHGAKASFNLNAGLHESKRKFGWSFKGIKDVYRLASTELTDVYEGFLVANHTTTHPFLEKIPIQTAKREIVEGRDSLEQMFRYPVLGFAYPFGTYNESVKEAVRDGGHVYARTVKNVKTAFPPDDPIEFHSNCHFLNPNFQEIFEAAAPSGVFYFWGHSYEIVTEDDWAAFDKQIAWLSNNPRVEWTNLPDLFLPQAAGV